jgi:hypothetical protein
MSKQIFAGPACVARGCAYTRRVDARTRHPPKICFVHLGCVHDFHPLRRCIFFPRPLPRKPFAAKALTSRLDISENPRPARRKASPRSEAPPSRTPSPSGRDENHIYWICGWSLNPNCVWSPNNIVSGMRSRLRLNGGATSSRAPRLMLCRRALRQSVQSTWWSERYYVCWHRAYRSSSTLPLGNRMDQVLKTYELYSQLGYQCSYNCNGRSYTALDIFYTKVPEELS